MHGKRRTAPRGMEIEELPFNRIRRLKNANLGDIRSFCRDRSSREGKLGEEGIRFRKLFTRPIDTDPWRRFRWRATDLEQRFPLDTQLDTEALEEKC